MKSELISLDEDLKYNGKNKDNLQTKLEALEQTQETLLTQIEDQTTQNTDNDTVLAELTTSNQQLKYDIESLKKELIELPQKKAELEANTASIRTEHKALDEQFQKQHQAFSLKKEENAALLDSLSNMEAENARLREQLQQELAKKNLTQKTISATNQLNTATQQNQQLDSDVKKKSTKNQKLLEAKKRLSSEITKLEAEVGSLKSTKQQLGNKQADMDGCFMLNCLSQLSGGEILAYSLLAFVLLASIAGIALATWGTGLAVIAPIATTLLTASIAGASVSGAGLMVTSGYSLFSHCKSKPEEVLPAPELKIIGLH